MTEGQEEVYKLAKEMSPGHIGIWGNHGGPSKEFQNEFTNRIRNNEIIKNDKVTGRSLNGFGFSKAYLEYLKQNTEGIRLTSDYPEFSLDLFDYNRGCFDPSPTYMGGDKYHSTYSCLLSLYQGSKLTSSGWTFMYVEDLGYTSIMGGGNHRSLANMLLGKTKIYPQSMTIFKNTGVDQELNTSILGLEENFEEVLILKNYTDALEAQQIKQFVKETTRLETLVIKKYLDTFKEFSSSWPGHRDNRLHVKKLIEIRSSVREVMGIIDSYRKSFIHKWKFELVFVRTNEFNLIEKIIIDIENQFPRDI